MLGAAIRASAVDLLGKLRGSRVAELQKEVLHGVVPPSPLFKSGAPLCFWDSKVVRHFVSGTQKTCPVSTEGWTRRVQLVREGGGGGVVGDFTLSVNVRRS